MNVDNRTYLLGKSLPLSEKNEDRIHGQKIIGEGWAVLSIFITALAAVVTGLAIKIIGFNSWILFPLAGLMLALSLSNLPYLLTKLEPKLLPQIPRKAPNEGVQPQAVQRKPWRPRVLKKRTTPPKTAEEIWGKRDAPAKELPFNLPKSRLPSRQQLGWGEKLILAEGQEDLDEDSEITAEEWQQKFAALRNDPSAPQYSA